MKNKILIIAEAGVNHNGDLGTAKKLIEAASDCGADLIKFQTFNSKLITTNYTPKANYQNKNVDNSFSQLEMLKRLELSKDAHNELIEYCKKLGIGFFTTAFDIDSIKYVKSLNLSFFKIPSGEITNKLYLEEIGNIGKPLLLSTGMSTLGEIESALNILEIGGVKRRDIFVLHCNTEYPTPMKDVNLLAMNTIGNSLGVNIGYSDHTKGIEVAIAASALGAMVIEKHLTLDQKQSGPDHNASTEPAEFLQMVRAIRNIENALGSKIKKPTESEIKNIPFIRKSIVAKKSIEKGEIFSINNITTKRPGNGISPMMWDNVIGRVASKTFDKDELIEI